MTPTMFFANEIVRFVAHDDCLTTFICYFNSKFSSIKWSTSLWIKCTKNAKNYFLDLFIIRLHMCMKLSLLKLALWKISNMSNLKDQFDQ